MKNWLRQQASRQTQILHAYLPRSEVICEMPEHELTCVCGRRNHTSGKEVSEPIEIVPLRIRGIKNIRKVYRLRNGADQR